MRLLGRALNFCVLFCCLVLCAIPVAEFGQRGLERLIWLRGCIKCDSGTMIMGVRLNQRLWKMFLGADAKDLRVLPGNQSTAILLPREGKWTAVDFLLPEALRDQSRFTVTSDAFGFRGQPQSVSARSYKVLVLGSYQAFGHGVEDSETYSAKLLELLKKSPGLRSAGLTPVVWNGGMQSAALDRGIKVLEKYLNDLKPNLVILDYGMTDQVSAGLNPWLQPFAALADQHGETYQRLDKFTRENSTGFFGKLYLFTDLVNRGMEKNLPANRERWNSQVTEVIAKLKSQGVKVLLLDQPVAGMPAEFYQRAVGRFSNADYLSVPGVLNSAAANLSTPLPDPLWMSEFPEAFQAYYRRKAPFYPYLGSILHINARGHSEVARALAEWVEKHGIAP